MLWGLFAAHGLAARPLACYTSNLAVEAASEAKEDQIETTDNIIGNAIQKCIDKLSVIHFVILL